MSNKIAWKDINWSLVQKRLSRQQKRVYRASMEGNKSKVHALQRRIIGSLDAKLMAVKRVTTENKECNTDGVDRQKSLSNDKKIELAYKLKLNGKASPIRRTYISKPGKNKDRPLDISTIEDKAKQMLAKLALEPEWEAIFEPNSYGFGPGRSCHDAIAALFLLLKGKSRFVFNANIQKCFDRIEHDKLLRKLATFDLMECQIRAWLKADIMVGYLNRPKLLIQAMEGIPQSEIISLVLANIALHGLEEYIKDWYVNYYYPFTGNSTKIPKRDRMRSIGFSHYASNFVITAPKLSDLKKIEKQVELWLINEVGLELSKAKTRIVNSTEGFEFLGFQLISIKIKDNEYKIKINPSKSSKAQIIDKTSKIIRQNKSASSYNLIKLLAPRIIGWANYFQFSECQETFTKIDYVIHNQLRAWVFRRKSKGLRSRTQLKEKYFPSGRSFVFKGKSYQNNWVLVGETIFKDKKKEIFLPKMSWVTSSQHIKIKDKASPYNGDYLY